MGTGLPTAHLHQPLPRVHRPHLSRSMRESLRAEPRRARAHHQPRRRRRHRRGSISRGVCASTSTREKRQERSGHRSRSCRPCRRQRPQPDGLPSHCFREERSRRRPSPLRHSQLQTQQSHHRPPHEIVGRRRYCIQIRPGNHFRQFLSTAQRIRRHCRRHRHPYRPRPSSPRPHP